MMALISQFAVSKDAFPTEVVGAYGLCAGAALAVYHLIAEGAFSSTLTMSAMVHCLGASFLCMQVHTTGSAAGISAGALSLDAMALAFRLSSTLWLDGYLPVDKSGDHVYQIADLSSLVLTLGLLYHILVKKRSTYQADEDNFRIAPMVLASLALATMFHADMDDYPLFDTLWMTGLFTGAVSVMPQLWLIMQTGGRAEALTAHYIAALAVSRVLSGAFMWAARFDMTCVRIFESVNHGIIAILGAHLLHLLLLGDFAYYYIRAMLLQGVSAPVELTGAALV